ELHRRREDGGVGRVRPREPDLGPGGAQAGGGVRGPRPAGAVGGDLGRREDGLLGRGGFLRGAVAGAGAVSLTRVTEALYESVASWVPSRLGAAGMRGGWPKAG